MAVTPDKYELPLIVCDTATELAKILGIAPETIYSSISKNSSGTTTGRKLVKVEVEDDLQSNSTCIRS